MIGDATWSCFKGSDFEVGECMLYGVAIATRYWGRMDSYPGNSQCSVIRIHILAILSVPDST